MDCLEPNLMKQQPHRLFSAILKPEIWLLFIAFILPSLLLYADFLPRRRFSSHWAAFLQL